MYLFPVDVTPRAVSRSELGAPVRAGRGPAHDQERDHGDGLQLRHVPRHHVSGQHVHHHAAHSVVSAPGSYKTKSFESRVREKKKMTKVD